MSDEVMDVTSPEHFKALSHPMRHRLLFALDRQPATISQLATRLDTRKGNIAHHLKVLRDAGLIEAAGTRQVRGGTEQYYRRAARALRFTGPHSQGNLAVAFQAVADEISAAAPDPLLVLRHLRLTPDQVDRITAVLTSLVNDTTEADDDNPRYGLLVGLYRQPGPREPRATGAVGSE